MKNQKSERGRSFRAYRQSRRRWAPLARVMCGVFAWSFVVGQITSGLAAQAGTPRPKGHTRRLSSDEMRHIVGAQHAISVAQASGPAFPWEGSVANTNTGNGNKTTEVPIVGWTARGGMPVQLTLYHNSQGNHNSELGQKWTFSYDIYAVVDGSGNFTVHWGDDLSYEFTKSGSSYTAPTGIHDSVVANGSPTITSYDLTTVRQIKYHFTNPNGTGWYCASITDRNGNVITINHDSGNYVTSIVDPNSRTITLSYTSGRISSISDPLSRSWSISYNGSGELTQVTWPAVGGSSYNEQFAYDAGSHHDIVTYTDQRGHTGWSATYNSSDNSLASITDACSNGVTFTYALGETDIQDANGNTIEHDYSSGRLSTVYDAAGNSEQYSYDTSNNRTGMTDRRGHSYSFTFDSSGNMLTKTDPLSHTWTWTFTSKNDVASLTDPVGNKVVNTFDTPGNLTEVDEKDGSNVLKASTTFAYDSGNHGLLVSKTDNNSHTTSYGRNTNGELTSVTTPGNHTTSWTVNGLGVRTSRTDALSNTTNYTLDNWNRVTGIDYPTGTDPSFTFDANGNLTGWTDGVGTWARTYDNDDRILTESLGGTTRCTWSYDGTGKKGLLSSVTAADARTITYGYTNRNQLYTVTENSATTTMGYDANGNETSETLPNTATVTKVYDNADRLTSITNKNSGNTVLSSFSYTYGNDNRRASCTEANSDVVSWGYDAQGHLTSESRTGSNSYSASYTVDGVGNRTSQTIGTKTTSFTFDSDDELTATSSSTGGFVNSYSYNSDGMQTGRTLSGTAWTLSYDYEGQLLSTATGGSTISSFVYDALGRRYSRANGGTTTVFYYGPGGILNEKQGSTFTAAYAYGNGLIRKDGEYPMMDGLGSERTVTNSSQTVTGTIKMDAFGLTVNTTGSSSNPYKFAANSGYRDDGDAGLVHVGARYHDPQVGRFITRDTELDQKAYLYCEHDPVNAVDPSGHDPVWWNPFTWHWHWPWSRPAPSPRPLPPAQGVGGVRLKSGRYRLVNPGDPYPPGTKGITGRPGGTIIAEPEEPAGGGIRSGSGGGGAGGGGGASIGAARRGRE